MSESEEDDEESDLSRVIQENEIIVNEYEQELATLWVWFTFGMGYFVAVFGLIATAEPVTFDSEEDKKDEAIRAGVTDGNGKIIE